MLSTSRKAYYRRKLDRASSEADKERIRQKQIDESHCGSCDGTGFSPVSQGAGDSQRTWCEDCYGTGSGHSGESCKRCRGLGHLCLGEADSFFTLACCPRCSGSGEIPDEEAEDICPVCRGEGATIPITVRGKGSSRHGFGPDVGASQADKRSAAGSTFEPDEFTEAADESAESHDEALFSAFESLTRTRRRLARVLALYRGEIGNKWGNGHPWGRKFVIWPETEAGQTMMAEAPEKMRRELGARPVELLARIRDEEERANVPTMRVRALIAHADRQATQLIDEAKAALAEALAQ